MSPHRTPASEVARSEIQTLRAGLPVFDLSTKVLDVLAELITESGPVGQEVFDLLLVAQMRSHGIATLCTYNTKDFRRFAGIQAETPEAILAQFGISRGRGP
jgi:predicted nucleic acid-binding protein